MTGCCCRSLHPERRVIYRPVSETTAPLVTGDAFSSTSGCDDVTPPFRIASRSSIGSNRTAGASQQNSNVKSRIDTQLMTASARPLPCRSAGLIVGLRVRQRRWRRAAGTFPPALMRKGRLEPDKRVLQNGSSGNAWMRKRSAPPLVRARKSRTGAATGAEWPLSTQCRLPLRFACGSWLTLACQCAADSVRSIKLTCRE